MRKIDRLDDVLYGKLRLFQPDTGPRVNVDTILLSAFAKLKRGEKVLELGSAHGAISLILALRFPGVSFIEGLELQEGLLDMSRTNASENGLEDLVNFKGGDLRRISTIYPAQGFDAVVVNPPYFEYSSTRRSASRSREMANHETMCSLDEVIAAARYVLKNRGRLYLVMRSARLPALLNLLVQNNLEPKVIRPVYPSPGKDSNVVLVYACKNAGKGMEMREPLFIYDGKGEYGPDFLKAYSLEESPCL